MCHSSSEGTRNEHHLRRHTTQLWYRFQIPPKRWHIFLSSWLKLSSFLFQIVTGRLQDLQEYFLGNTILTSYMHSTLPSRSYTLLKIIQPILQFLTVKKIGCNKLQLMPLTHFPSPPTSSLLPSGPSLAAGVPSTSQPTKREEYWSPQFPILHLAERQTSKVKLI